MTQRSATSVRGNLRLRDLANPSPAMVPIQNVQHPIVANCSAVEVCRKSMARLRTAYCSNYEMQRCEGLERRVEAADHAGVSDTVIYPPSPYQPTSTSVRWNGLVSSNGGNHGELVRSLRKPPTAASEISSHLRL